MTAVLTIENSVNNLNNFISDVDSSGNSYYFWVGKTTPWPNDASPPPANGSYEEILSSYHDMVFGKLLSNNNISALTRYIPWTANTVYAQYDPNDQNLYSVNFYVVTTDYSVYKCIDNNNAEPSTTQPSLKPTVGCFQSTDGYTWKYMFTIPSAANSVFSSTEFVPVTPNNAVVNSAVSGTIDVIRLPIKGTDYQGFNEGTIVNVVSPQQIQLANTAVQVDQFYTGCTLYLKSGLGAGQISNIVTYNGASQLATVNPPFNTYIDMELMNVQGSFSNGQLLVQNYQTLAFLYANGYFNIGDTLAQTDTGLSGRVQQVNSVAVILTNTSNNNQSFSTNLAFYNPATVSVYTGNVICTVGSNVISSNGSSGMLNLATANLAIGQFIRVGNNPSASNTSNYKNVRRITGLTNSTYITVDTPFTSSTGVNGDFLYNSKNAAYVTSATSYSANAIIAETNLTSLTLTYANSQPNNSSFVLGEIVKEYSNAGIDLGANGIVAFVNSSTMIITGVQGTFTVGNNVVGLGQTSNTTAYISNITNYPNITLSEINGTFLNGFPVLSYNLGGVLAVGNATPVSYIYIPSDNVQYIISPMVTIEGDGEDAQAYCIVNNAPGSLFEITKVVPLNVGIGYTYANVYISAPAGYGSGANAIPVVSPVEGHGGDAISELGATYAGIAVTFDTAANELYKYPSYGQYRRVGIIKNPLFNDVFFNIGPTIRNNLNINSLTFAFQNNEIIFQPATNTAARFLSGNSSVMQVDTISGQFSNTGNATVIGLISNAYAMIGSINTLNFGVNNEQPIYDANTNVAGVLTQSTNTSQIRLSNVGGKIYLGDTLYDPIVNSYANVISIYTANDVINSSAIYGERFNQTSRITLTTNSSSFLLGERIVQPINQGNGLVIDNTHELDLVYASTGGTITTGLLLTDTQTGANGIVSFVNSNYIRLTGVQGTFTPTNSFSVLTGNGVIEYVFPVLVVGDVLEPFENNNNPIIGLTSSAIGVANIAGTMIQSDLTKNTGEILYVNDIAPFSVNLASKEVFQTVLSF